MSSPLHIHNQGFHPLLPVKVSARHFDSLPHSAHIAQGLALFKTDHKESYKYTFVLTVVFPVIFSLVAVIGAILFY